MALSVFFQELSVLVWLLDKDGKKAWILLSIICVFFVCLASGRPPRVWRRNGHGDGTLHPGRSRLRYQPLLLRLHPERNQVHLPQEVLTCSLQSIVTSQE